MVSLIYELEGGGIVPKVVLCADRGYRDSPHNGDCRWIPENGHVHKGNEMQGVRGHILELRKKSEPSVPEMELLQKVLE